MKNEVKLAKKEIIDCLNNADKSIGKIFIQCPESSRNNFEEALRLPEVQAQIQTSKITIELMPLTKEELDASQDLQAIQLAYILLAEGIAKGDEETVHELLIRTTISAQIYLRDMPIEAGKKIAKFSHLRPQDYELLENLVKIYRGE
ncbi:MAG: hypothetical protein WBA13_08410 [Microcoleaceae cyanobacterium]